MELEFNPQANPQKISNCEKVIELTQLLRQKVDLAHESGVFDRRNYDWLVSAIESTRNTTRALEVSTSPPDHPNNSFHYLSLYGSQQAIYVQQDSLQTLGKILGVPIDVKDSPDAERARKTRNSVAGHPSSEPLSGGIKAHTIVSSSSFTADTFVYKRQLTSGSSSIQTVFVGELVQSQLSFARESLNALIDKLSEKI